jgi:hypothetical protein
MKENKNSSETIDVYYSKEKYMMYIKKCMKIIFYLVYFFTNCILNDISRDIN